MLDSPSKMEPNLAPAVSAVVKTEPKDTSAVSNPPIVPPQQVAKSEETEAPVPSSEQVAVASIDAPPPQPPVQTTSEQVVTAPASADAPSLPPPNVQSEESNAPTLPVGKDGAKSGETLPKAPALLNQDATNEESVPSTIMPLPTQPSVQLPTPAPPPAIPQSPTIPTAVPASMSVAPVASVKTEPGPEVPPVPPQSTPAPLLSATPVKTENASVPPAIPQEGARPAPAPSAAAPQQSGATNTGPSPTAAAPTPAPRPGPRNLPKSCKNRPKNSRVFVGNLASEFTSAPDMVDLFSKYGELIEEPVLRRSFGFIQYGNPEAALRAVAGEQGKIIGGIPIDLSIADNREVKRGTHVANNTPFPHGPKGKQYRQMHHRNNYGHNNHHNNHHNNRDNMNGNNMASRKRRRSVSPGGGPARRMGGVHPPQFRRSRPEPRNGIHMRILCMSGTAKHYARQCESMFRAETGLGCDIVQIVAAGLGEGLGKCMQFNIPYVLVVASKDVEDGTCTIRTLERTGYEKSGRGNGIISLREAIDVCLIDRGITPSRGAVGGQGGHLAMPNPYGPPQPQVQMVQAGWTQQPGGMQGGGQYPARKPGWMSGPRAPPHPQNDGHHRGGPPPPPGGMDNAPNTYNQPPMAAHQMPTAGRPPYPQPYNMQPPPGAPPIPDYQGAAGAPVQQQVGWPGGPGGYGPPPPPPPPPHQDYSRGGHAMGGMGNPGNGNRNGGNEYDPTAVMTAGSGQPPPQDTAGYGGWQGQQQMTGGQAPMTGGGNSANGRYMPQQNAYQPPAYGGAPPQNYQQRPPPQAPYNASTGSQGHGNTYPTYNQQPQLQNQRQQHTGGWQNNQGPPPQQQPGVAANNQPARGGGNSNAPSVDYQKLANLVSVFQQRNDVAGSGGVQQNAPLLSQQPYGNNGNGNSNDNHNHNHNRQGNNNQYNAYAQYQAPQQQTAQGHQSRNYSRR